MPEILKNLSEAVDMAPVDESTSRELRSKIDRAFDQYHELNVTVARIDARFDAAEKRITEKITDLVDAIKKLAEIGTELNQVRLNQQNALKEHVHFEEIECKHTMEIDAIKEKLHTYTVVIRVLAIVTGFLSAVAVPVVAGWLAGMFGGGR